MIGYAERPHGRRRRRAGWSLTDPEPTILWISRLLRWPTPRRSPTIDTRNKAEPSFDGLLPVRHSNFARAWVDPTIDLSRYTKIMGGGAQFEFRAARKPSGTQAGRTMSNQTTFPISEKDQQKIAETASEIFEAELAKSKRFEWTEEKGDDVLAIRGAMLDIVSRVPPHRMQTGRQEIFLSSVGEITSWTPPLKCWW